MWSAFIGHHVAYRTCPSIVAPIKILVLFVEIIVERSEYIFVPEIFIAVHETVFIDMIDLLVWYDLSGDKHRLEDIVQDHKTDFEGEP